MCFSETQSYINTIIIIIGSLYLYKKPKLSVSLFFLSLKDLIQGLLYRFINNKKITNILSIFSWIHITLHPLFINIFFSYFDNNFKYWNSIYIVCILFSLISIFILYDLNIFNFKECTKENKYDDMCSDETGSYLGKYHIAYKFKTTEYKNLFLICYFILSFISIILTNVKILKLLIIILFLYVLFIYKGLKIGNGEQSAIWCFTTFIYFLPIALFEKQIKKFKI